MQWAVRMGDVEMVYFTAKVSHRKRVISLDEATYLKAEHKYVTLYTKKSGTFVLDDRLKTLEAQLGDQVLRIHRNCLVMRHAIEGITDIVDPVWGSRWYMQLYGVEELLPISRRAAKLVRKVLRNGTDSKKENI